ncbi:hypothetical protein ABW19_dt0209165 [Dactylella cylindrospora]|nr:hypothetical protein ABW19_dt0209165 [Dactylella cylindrospora]
MAVRHSSRISSLICASLAFTVLLLTGSSNACGVLTHNEILRRSRYIFSLTSSPSAAASENQDTSLFYRHHAAISQILSSPSVVEAEQAGAFFPDWGYGCFSNDVQSEAAHWPPFISASIRHFYKKYGPMFSDDVSSTAAGANISKNTLWPNGTTMTEDEQEHKEKLLAFIYATALHGSSDATWHSLKMYNGFIRMVAGLDFGGSYSDAHTTVDTGGDIILSKRMDGLPPENNPKDWVSVVWWVPMDDIFEIYESMGISVGSLTFRFCIARGLAAMRAIVTAGGSLYETYAEKSPAMIDFFDEYYLGGLDEMAANAVWCWRNLTLWMVEGKDDGSDGWNMCDTFKLIKARDGGKIEPPDPPFLQAEKEHKGPFEELIAKNRDFRKLVEKYEDNVFQDDLLHGAIEIYIPADYLLFHASDAPTSSDKFHIPHPTPSPFPGTFQEPTFLGTRKPFSKFGSYLSIGTHGTSGILSGDEPRIAQDGSIDLVVSAFVESEDQDYLAGGAVYSIDLKEIFELKGTDEARKAKKEEMVRLSLKNPPGSAGIWATETCRVTASLKDNTATVARIPAAIPNHPNARFGAATTPLRLRSGVYNVVTSPGPQVYNDSSVRIGFIPSGTIELFLGPYKVLSIGFEDLPDGSHIGEREFGATILAADIDGDGEDEIIVGIPHSDRYRPGCGVQMAEGEVVVLKVNKLIEASQAGCAPYQDVTKVMIPGAVQRVTLPVEEKRGEECNQNTYDWFGKSLVWLEKNQLVGIGAPGRGKVLFFKYNPVTGSLEWKFSVNGERGKGFGGWGLESGVSKNGKEWVAVGVPNDEHQIGHLKVYRIVEGVEAVLIAKVVSEEQERYGKFGMVLKGDDAEGGLWVGSSWAGKEKGAVWWVDIEAVVDWDGKWEDGVKEKRMEQVVMGGKLDTKEVVREVVVGVQIWGMEEKAHFGASIELADINGDGRTDLIVGIPFQGVSKADENMRFTGAVAVYIRTDAELDMAGAREE